MKAYLESFNLFSNEEIEDFLDICEYKTLKKMISF